jgi:hypothetical protein
VAEVSTGVRLLVDLDRHEDLVEEGETVVLGAAAVLRSEDEAVQAECETVMVLVTAAVTVTGWHV